MKTLALGLCLLAAPQDPRPGPVREKYPNGRTRLSYSRDRDGKRHGRYVEYYENGKKKIEARYAHGKLDGKYEENFESGRTRVRKRYDDGVLQGDLLRFDEKGVLLHRVTVRRGEVFLYSDFRKPFPAFPRTEEEIRAKVKELDPPDLRRDWPRADRYEEPPSIKPPFTAGKLRKEYVDYALREIKVYRWLCRLSPDVTADPGYNDFAQHGAVVTAANGDLSHDPKKPAGMDDAFFAKGDKGCGSSNLSFSPGGDFRRALYGFMADSDASNIDDVGHRGWILNPRAGKFGFGEAGKRGEAKALWVFDRSAKGAQAPDVLSYPGLGRFPVEYFHGRSAWSVAPRAADFKMPSKDGLEVEVWKLDGDYDLAEKIEIDHVSVTGGAMGRAAVFRPVFKAPGELLDGTATFLAILKNPSGERLVHLVRFFSLRE